MLEREDALAFWLLFPTLVLLTLFIAYPFVRGVWLSVTNSMVGEPGHFIGLRNFTKIFHDSIFRTAALNTFVYTGVTTVFKLALGLWLALLLNRSFRGKSWVRAFVLLPFIIPTVLSTLAWKWMFDPTFSVFNWLFWKLSIIQTFSDFQLIYVLTGGGPANATHLFATYAYQLGIGTGLLSEGAAISLAMFPALLLVVVFQLWYIRRVENR